MQTFRLLLLAGLLAFLPGCEMLSWDGFETTTESTTLTISHGTWFGLCAGYCRTELDVTATSVTHTRIAQVSDEPTLTLERQITPDEWRALEEHIDWDLLNGMQDVYGCPDCADGGSEWIEVADGERTKQITFEYGKAPREIAALVDDLRALSAAFEREGR